MSLEHIEGNLLDCPKDINVIAHSVNSRGVMGKGLALSIKEEYPIAFEVYDKQFKSKEGLQLGTFTVAELPSGKRIVNLVTQEDYGNDRRYVDYEAFYVSLKVLKNCLESAQKEGRNYVLGLPHKISCNNAGGSWPVIMAMIADIFVPSTIKCYIVTLPAKKNIKKKEESKEVWPEHQVPLLDKEPLLDNPPKQEKEENPTKIK